MKRTAWMTLMTMAIAPTAVAGHKRAAAGPVVAVCLEQPLTPNYVVARSVAGTIFAGIGITLEWHFPGRCPNGALRITLAEETRDDFRPGALAYALPFEGTHIVVFLDRIGKAVPEHTAPYVLGHVFAHEIAHILQNCSHHSDSGLMKANWTTKDFGQMAWHPLTLTPLDIELIHEGMAGRPSTRAMALVLK